MIPLPPQKTESPCEAVLQPQQFQRALRKLLSLCEAVRKHYVIGLSDKTLWTQQLGQVYPSSNEPTIAPNLCAECLCQNGKTPSCLVRCASKPEALNFPIKTGRSPSLVCTKKVQLQPLHLDTKLIIVICHQKMPNRARSQSQRSYHVR